MTALSCYRVEKGHIGPSDNWITHSCEEGHYCDLERKTFKADKKKNASFFEEINKEKYNASNWRFFYQTL